MSVKLQLDQLDSSNLFFNNMVPHIWNCANAGINVQLNERLGSKGKWGQVLFKICCSVFSKL
jgi:hypothetical protein